jgi:hypothetical protein
MLFPLKLFNILLPGFGLRQATLFQRRVCDDAYAFLTHAFAEPADLRGWYQIIPVIAHAVQHAADTAEQTASHFCLAACGVV